MTVTNQSVTRLLTYKEVCKITNRDRRTIWVWVRKGAFPSPIKTPAGVCIGWRPADVQSWIDGVWDAMNSRANKSV